VNRESAALNYHIFGVAPAVGKIPRLPLEGSIKMSHSACVGLDGTSIFER
jgi:hypothetical protein